MTYNPPPWADKPSYDEGFEDGGDSEVARIRAALLYACNEPVRPDVTDRQCLLPKGHIGGHYWASDYDPAKENPTIAVTRTRLEEILNG